MFGLWVYFVSVAFLAFCWLGPSLRKFVSLFPFLTFTHFLFSFSLSYSFFFLVCFAQWLCLCCALGDSGQIDTHTDKGERISDIRLIPSEPDSLRGTKKRKKRHSHHRQSFSFSLFLSFLTLSFSNFGFLSLLCYKAQHSGWPPSFNQGKLIK